MLKKLLAALAMSYAALSFAAVDVNTATVADLDSVKGIGPAMSARIMDERKKAPFKDWGDLITRVKGVGGKSAAKLSTGGLTVNGASYTAAGAPAAKPAKAPAAPAKAEAAPAAAAQSAKPAAASKP
mgnify:CR=1 FL=1|jgi:competence protein ComEA